MLVIVDMQNQILDPTKKNYVKGATSLIPKLAKRLSNARKKGEIILFLKDIPIELKDQKESLSSLQIINELSPLPHELVIEKNYFCLPPEKLLKIKSFLANEEISEGIEVTGVELSLCVLGNLLALQSAFPDQDFYLNQDLVAGNEFNETALQLLPAFNVTLT